MFHKDVVSSIKLTNPQALLIMLMWWWWCEEGNHILWEKNEKKNKKMTIKKKLFQKSFYLYNLFLLLLKLNQKSFLLSILHIQTSCSLSKSTHKRQLRRENKNPQKMRFALVITNTFSLDMRTKFSLSTAVFSFNVYEIFH